MFDQATKQKIKNGAMHCYTQYKVAAGAMLVLGAVMTMKDASEITDESLDKVSSDKSAQQFYNDIASMMEAGVSLEIAIYAVMKSIAQAFVNDTQSFIDKFAKPKLAQS